MWTKYYSESWPAPCRTGRLDLSRTVQTELNWVDHVTSLVWFVFFLCLFLSDVKWMYYANAVHALRIFMSVNVRLSASAHFGFNVQFYYFVYDHCKTSATIPAICCTHSRRHAVTHAQTHSYWKTTSEAIEQRIARRIILLFAGKCRVEMPIGLVRAI